MFPHHLATPVKSQEQGKATNIAFKRRSCFRVLLLKENYGIFQIIRVLTRPPAVVVCEVEVLRRTVG